MIALHPFSAKAGADRAHLRIMETTDLHAHIYPYDYYADRPVDTLGLARAATLIAELRAGASNALVFDNGDFLQGNPMGDYIAYERGMDGGAPHPVIAAMNSLGLDAATLGNHEFNYGLDFLMKSLAGAAFPLVLANVATKAGADPRADRTLLPPYVILDRDLVDGSGARHPVRIGVIGFVTPQIMVWDRKHLHGRLSARDIVRTAEARVPELRAAGCDLVIALCHSGIGAEHWSEGMEHAAIPLAAVEGIDVVLTGHSHQVFPSTAFAGRPGVDASRGTLAGKPAVMAGLWGSHVGLVDLLLERQGGRWRIADFAVEARPICQRRADHRVVPLVESAAPVLAAAEAAHAATLAYIRRPVGRTAVPLYSHFALVAGDASLEFVSRAQIWYAAEALRDGPHAHLPLLSAAAPFKAGGRAGPDHYTDVPAGDLAIRNMADLYLYPNTIRAVKVTGAELREWLERSAGVYNRILPGAEDAALINPDFPSYNFDVIHGVSYEIDLGAPSRYDTEGRLVDAGARRVVNLCHDGKPVDPAAEFVVVTNSHRAGGGGAFPGAGGDTIIFEGPEANRDIIVRYIQTQGTVRAGGPGNWRFRPMPGTTVLFDTGPGALAHLADLTSLAITAAGEAPEGFMRFRIAL